MDNLSLIKADLEESRSVLDQFLSDEKNLTRIGEAAELMTKSVRNGGKIISCGNGGSMCDAMHFAEELTGRFRDDRRPLPALSISDPSHLSCVANDYGYDQVFSRFVEAIGRKDDVLLAISTSGNSGNVIAAMKQARKNGMKVVGLTGKDGGKMAGLCDVEIRAPQTAYADRAQEIHIKVIHALIHCLENK
jgi:D-sedoheptulose 7-phosphate isomerase